MYSCTISNEELCSCGEEVSKCSLCQLDFGSHQGWTLSHQLWYWVWMRLLKSSDDQMRLVMTTLGRRKWGGTQCIWWLRPSSSVPSGVAMDTTRRPIEGQEKQQQQQQQQQQQEEEEEEEVHRVWNKKADWRPRRPRRIALGVASRGLKRRLAVRVILTRLLRDKRISARKMWLGQTWRSLKRCWNCGPGHNLKQIGQDFV